MNATKRKKGRQSPGLSCPLLLWIQTTRTHPGLSHSPNLPIYIEHILDLKQFWGLQSVRSLRAGSVKHANHYGLLAAQGSIERVSQGLSISTKWKLGLACYSGLFLDGLMCLRQDGKEAAVCYNNTLSQPHSLATELCTCTCTGSRNYSNICIIGLGSSRTFTILGNL